MKNATTSASTFGMEFAKRATELGIKFQKVIATVYVYRLFTSATNIKDRLVLYRVNREYFRLFFSHEFADHG